MNRRGFIQISATALLPLLLGAFPRGDDRKRKFSHTVVSGRKFGHLLRAAANTTPSKTLETEIIIVGGGIAGLSAAAKLRDRDFQLFETSDRLGGSSASGHWKGTHFAMGAHYDLAYPEYYGKDVIDFLLELGIVTWNPRSRFYEFTESKYCIREKDMEQCFLGDQVLGDVLEDAPGLEEFRQILLPYDGKMPMPLHHVDPDLQYLDQLTFKDFLEQKMTVPAELARRISYQMLDDWGGTWDEVSALAGIHYYMCRPYHRKDIPLFSPPEGNAYFAQRMIGHTDRPERLHVNTLVRAIRETPQGVVAEVLHPDGTVSLVRGKKLIYAGQKQALPYLMPEAAGTFKNTCAPWAVVNIVCRKGLDVAKWQNDVISDEPAFMGFVNSGKQHTRSETHEVLSAYYCFRPEERKFLETIEADPEKFIAATLSLLEEQTTLPVADFTEHVNIHLMGHAMPVPVPGYLSFDRVSRFSDKIVFAGVDTGRLPIFFEACDSGIQAAAEIQRRLLSSGNTVI